MTMPSSFRDRDQAKFVQSPTRSDGSAVEVVGSFASVDSQYSTLVDLVSSSLIYLGEAIPGSLSSSPSWLIKKIVISGSSISILCANGSGDYDQIWDDRSALTYV